MNRYKEVLAALDEISKLVTDLRADIIEMERAASMTGAAIGALSEMQLSSNELDGMIQWYNELMKLEDKSAIIQEFKHRLQYDTRLERIYFADYRRYCNDHSYAVFRKDANGSVFVMPTAQTVEGNRIYAAFPLPTNAYWYERGSELVNQMYSTEPETSSLFPRLSIGQIALLKRYRDTSEDPDGYEYVPYQRGFLRLNQ